MKFIALALIATTVLAV